MWFELRDRERERVCVSERERERGLKRKDVVYRQRRSS